MIVVSNTSPLTNLAAIGQFKLLEKLYGRVYIPEAVWQELNASERAWPGSQETADAAWMERRPVEQNEMVALLRRDLDNGEAEAIVLALDLGADLLLLDEHDGRRAAERLGLQVLGVVGLLIQAKHQDLIADLRPQLDALRHQAGFYLSDSVYQMALGLAGES